VYIDRERITASSYGYPSDIWSFGLTLLAVANGSFPLKMGDGEGGGGQNWGGSGGYWGMVEAVCDNEPPTTGPEFSFEFSEFIKSTLRKSPDDRGTAEELLNHEFIRMNMSPSNASDSDHNGSNGTRPVPFSCTTPRGLGSSSGDDDHGHLSASLETSIVKRVSAKEKKQASPRAGDNVNGTRQSPPTNDAAGSSPEPLFDEGEDPDDRVSIETIRTKHLENIITKMVFRDELAEDNYSNKYGGTFVGGKLIRKESTWEDEGNLEEIEDVDDLFGGKRPGGSFRVSKINNDTAMRKVDRNYADLISSIMILQGGNEYDGKESSHGLTNKAHMPKLCGPDLQKWQNLARQLHLPLDHVIQVVESKLNDTLEMLRKEEMGAAYDGPADRHTPRNPLAKPSLRVSSVDSADDLHDTQKVMKVGKGSVGDLLSNYSPEHSNASRQSPKASPSVNNYSKSPIRSPTASVTNGSDVSNGRQRLGSAASSSPGIDVEFTMNTRTDDYGPCTSVVGVLFWVFEGLKYPFGITPSNSDDNQS
jgi:serine/threonine protein kinase